MKIILTTKVRNLGDIGDVVEVKNGYGRNYLIPRKLAIVYSVANYKFFEEKKKHFEEENLKNKKQAESDVSNLKGRDIVMIESASEDGKLYGSVSTARVAGQINKVLGEGSVQKSQILIKRPIKHTGKYKVTLTLHPEVVFEIDVIVATSPEDVQSIKKGEDKKDKKVEKEIKKESETETVDSVS